MTSCKKKSNVSAKSTEKYRSSCPSQPKFVEEKKTCHPLTSHVTPSFSHAKESRTPFDLYWNNYYKKHVDEIDYDVVPVKEKYTNSSGEIPPQNLPIYLQKYKVDIYPEKEETKVGNVSYTTVGAIPSNEPLARVWALNLTGVLAPNVEKYRIVYDFSEVDYEDYITFENTVSGTFNIRGRVLDASKIIGKNYTYSDKNRTLTIELDTSKWNFRLIKPTLFSYQLSINDCSQPCQSTPSAYPTNIQYTTSNYPYTLANGDTVTLVYNNGDFSPQNNSPALQVTNNNGYLELTSSYYYFYCNQWYRINDPSNSGFVGTEGTHTVNLGNKNFWCTCCKQAYDFEYNVTPANDGKNGLVIWGPMD